MLSSQTLLDGDPERQVRAGKRRVTDGDWFEGRAGKAKWARNEPRAANRKSKQRSIQRHSKPLLP
jgi:hypothetical protein